jgi:hypothetical protein
MDFQTLAGQSVATRTNLGSARVAGQRGESATTWYAEATIRRTSAGELGGGESGGGDEQRDELPQREAQQHVPPRAVVTIKRRRRRHRSILTLAARRQVLAVLPLTARSLAGGLD